MYDKQDLKVFLFCIIMALLNMLAFICIYKFMVHGSVRTTSLVITGLDIVTFLTLLGVGVHEGDRHDK